LPNAAEQHFQGGENVKPSLIDTDILSLFFRNHSKVADRFASYLVQHKKINFSIITYYEIVSGLKHRDAYKKMSQFLEFASKNSVFPLTEKSVTVSGEIYAELRKEGNPLDDIDLLIAGTAIVNNMVLITRNKHNFERIRKLEVENWSSPYYGEPLDVLLGIFHDDGSFITFYYDSRRFEVLKDSEEK